MSEELTKKQRVMVIGGSGFMGSHTADELSRQGYAVTIYDSQPSPWLRSDQKQITDSIMNKTSLEAAMTNQDIVYHFGGIADIGEAKRRPLDTIEINVMGLANAIDTAARVGVKRFVFASTMYVYSQYGSFYRASKQSAETLLEAYHEHFELDYTILRYGSLYGPRSQTWNGIRKFATQVLKEGKLSYHGTGEEMREYIHVSDAARLSVEVLQEQHKNQAIIITGQQLLKVDDLFSLVFEIAGKDRQVHYEHGAGIRDHYGNTPYRYTPKAAKKLVPTKFVDLGQGLLELIEEIDLTT